MKSLRRRVSARKKERTKDFIGRRGEGRDVLLRYRWKLYHMSVAGIKPEACRYLWTAMEKTSEEEARTPATRGNEGSALPSKGGRKRGPDNLSERV